MGAVATEKQDLLYQPEVSAHCFIGVVRGGLIWIAVLILLSSKLSMFPAIY